MKRIFIINPTLGVGGVERKLADIARYLAQQGELNAQIDLFLEERLPPDSDENVFLPLVQQSPVRIHVKPAAPFVSFFLYLLWQVIRRKPNIILAFSRRPSILALTLRELVRRRKPYIIIGNDSIASQALSHYVPQPSKRRLLQTQMRWLYPRADLFLVPSDTSKRDLSENFGVPADKIRVFKNWTPYHPLTTVPKRFDVIYVGRIDRVKHLTRLVEILRLLQPRLTSLHAVLVGDGNDMAKVQALARQYGLENNFSFVGFQDDIGTYLAQSKIFCLTSHFEGLSIAALEAMMYRLPVVTLNYAGAGELVQSGENGFLCANDAEFSDALYQLLTDDALRARMGQNAHAFVRREHGESVLADYVNTILNPE